MKKLLKIVTVVTAGAFLVTMAYAEGLRGPMDKDVMRKRMEKHRDKMMEELNLTQEQKDKITEHREKGMGDMKNSMEVIHSKRAELKEELEKKELDKTKIDALVAELKELEGKKIEGRVEHILFMRELLTDEQYEKFIKKVKEFEEKCGFGKRKGPGTHKDHHRWKREEE